MKITLDPRSPWGQRMWFEDSEFDAMADEARERAGVELFERGKGIDVDTLLLRGYQITPDFAADLPPDVLGRTLFLTDGRIEIEINRVLADEAETDATARHRLRSTLAHETAHVVQHAALHVPNITASLFRDEPLPSPRVLCRNLDIQNSGQPWWEFQANRGMASLLLPKQLVADTVIEVLRAHDQPTFTAAIDASRGREVIAAIARYFDTSFTITLYRLQALKYIPDNRQGEFAVG